MLDAPQGTADQEELKDKYNTLKNISKVMSNK